jgi:hypothetical protein
MRGRYIFVTFLGCLDHTVDQKKRGEGLPYEKRVYQSPAHPVQIAPLSGMLFTRGV